MSGPRVEFGPSIGGITFAEAKATRFLSQTEIGKSHLGKAIVGYATLYGKEHEYKSRTEIMMQGCFDKSISAGIEVGLFLDHKQDAQHFLGSTLGGRLEIFSDDIGLAFKFWPDASELCQAAMADVFSGARRECSVGYKTLEKSVVKFAHRKVHLIKSTILNDISICHKAAVRGTYATLIDPTASSLKADCLSGMLATRLEIRKAVDPLIDKILGRC